METIHIRGARQHNLKNISLEIPRQKFVVITGVSGSGKSTLAFDVLYAEGRRRYMASLSASARQFLTQHAKPEVDAISGLSPTVALEQRRTAPSVRSTVGTVSEIADHLRLLYARVGTPHCLECGRVIARHSVPQIVDQLLDVPAGSRLQLLAPIRLFHPDDCATVLQDLHKAGFVRVRLNGTIYDLMDSDLARELAGLRPGEIAETQLDIVVDRLVVKSGIAQRLADSLDTALRYGKDVVKVLIGENEERLFTQRLICPACGFAYPELSPAFFSPNSPEGACPACEGLGVQHNPPHPPLTKGGRGGDKRGSTQAAVGSQVCSQCHGSRLRSETQGIRIRDMSLSELTAKSLEEVLDFFSELVFYGRTEPIARPLCQEIVSRLQALVDLGLAYVTLDRTMVSLSGGEAQRVRLATLLGNGLSGVIHILDEPSVGLHPRDTSQLLEMLRRLCQQGNTVVVVEHDPETMLAADHLIDLGPGAGEQGGWVCAVGTPQDVKNAPNSLTGQYLSGASQIPVPTKRRPSKHCLTLAHTRMHNLKDICVDFPLGTLTCVTGVSGSGKSSLISDALVPALAAALAGTQATAAGIGQLSGWQHLNKMIVVDQAPIGRTPSSTPATYIGLLRPLRVLFAQLPEARVRGYNPDRFSFNVKGGRCEACEGNGVFAVEMSFLPDVYIRCDVCHGRRYNRETLAVTLRGRSIADVLNMTVAEALAAYGDLPEIRSRLEALRAVGLAYIRLGQAAPTLSGGEAQRLKLAKELSRKSTGRTLFLFDEPTTGLHLADIQRLLDIFTLLVEAGNTVVVIEHNLEVVKTADWVIDLGPEGGEAGGKVVACGPPEEIVQVEESYTGRFLKSLL